MNCTECGSETKVIDSREIGSRPQGRKAIRNHRGSTRRRRECLKCKHRFSTIESRYDIYYSRERVSETLKEVRSALLATEELLKMIVDLERREK